MTENEAKAIVHEMAMEHAENGEEEYCEALDIAIKALEEVQRWRTDVINPKIRSVFANTSTLICQNCDHKDEYIEELEAEIAEYNEVGTVEECKAAVEKQTAIPRKLIEGKYFCPKCHNPAKNAGYCVCGQKLY